MSFTSFFVTVSVSIQAVEVQNMPDNLYGYMFPAERGKQKSRVLPARMHGECKCKAEL